MGWLSGFTQDPFAIGDEGGMRAMEGMGMTRRFPMRRRPRFTGQHPEGWMGSEQAVEMGVPRPEMSTMRTGEATPVQSGPRFPAFDKYKETVAGMPEREGGV